MARFYFPTGRETASYPRSYPFRSTTVMPGCGRSGGGSSSGGMALPLSTGRSTKTQISGLQQGIQKVAKATEPACSACGLPLERVRDLCTSCAPMFGTIRMADCRPNFRALRSCCTCSSQQEHHFGQPTAGHADLRCQTSQSAVGRHTLVVTDPMAGGVLCAKRLHQLLPLCAHDTWAASPYADSKLHSSTT